MGEWRQVVLGDVLDIQHGFAFRGEFFDAAGTDVLLTPKNFEPLGGIDVSPDRCKRYLGPVDERFVLAQGDIVVAMTDLKQDAPILGSSGVVPAGGRYLHNQRIGKVLILEPDRLHRAFVPWLLNSPTVRDGVRATATGSTVRHTAPGRIRAITAPVPSVDGQRRIAAVLSAFDELIEINERRIELLEDLARSLYREWLVHFRFPGHEDVALVDSELGPIPEGWEVRRLGDVAELRYGKSLPAKMRHQGSVPVVSSAGIIDTHDRPLVEGPGIVIGRKGNVGSVWWIEADFFPIDTTYYVESELSLGFLYWRLQDLEFIDSHAAVPGLSRGQALAIPLVIPGAEVVGRYDRVNRALALASIGLRATIDSLVAARDLLLPRLVTGRLNISDIELGVLTPTEVE